MDDVGQAGARPDAADPGTRWVAEATVRTDGRVNAGTVEALARAGAVARCAARCSGAQGLSVRMDVVAESCAGAYGAALALLATVILPLLDGADLTDLRIVPGGEHPGDRHGRTEPAAA
ncbi:hypothetical protein [Kocuria sp. KH4]